MKAAILESISNLQRKIQNELGSSNRDRKSPLEKEERTNGVDGSSSRKRQIIPSENIVKGGTLLGTPDKRTSTQ